MAHNKTVFLICHHCQSFATGTRFSVYHTHKIMPDFKTITTIFHFPQIRDYTHSLCAQNNHDYFVTELAWRGGSIGRASDFTFHDPSSNPVRSIRKTDIYILCWLTVVCLLTHKNDLVRTVEILEFMSEFGRLLQHEKTQHALVGLPSEDGVRLPTWRGTWKRSHAQSSHPM